MRLGSIVFPDQLVRSIREGNFVIFAGAGVSREKPSDLPDFPTLTKEIAKGATIQQLEREPEDRYLGRLHHSKVDIHNRAAQQLKRDGLSHNQLHTDLLRLFRNVEKVQIVTTNFDLLFERASKALYGDIPEVFRAAALPLGRNFKGIVHVHGSVANPSDMVLSDADFGRAYLVEGWARRFLLDVFREHTVLFVGYSHNDVVMHYLSRAIPEHLSGRRFALTSDADELHRWRVLGIEPISYPTTSPDDHSALGEGLNLLAQAVNRNILDWKRELMDLAENQPPIDSELADKILYALEDISTTRIFVEYARVPEWLNWLDGHGVLDNLFSNKELTERDSVLMQWCADHYSIPCADALFLLIAKHEMKLHPQFWWLIGREIGIGDRYPIDETTLSRWVSLLLEAAPRLPDSTILHWLGERCGKMRLPDCLLKIFDEMSNSRLKIKPAIVWPGENDE